MAGFDSHPLIQKEAGKVGRNKIGSLLTSSIKATIQGKIENVQMFVYLI